MKKFLLFLVLTSLNVVAQTPIHQYSFDGNLANSNGTNAFVPNNSFAYTYVEDRHGNPSSALKCFAAGGTSQSFSTSLPNLPQGNAPRTISVWAKFDPYATHGEELDVFYYGTSATNQAFGLYQTNTLTRAYGYSADINYTSPNSSYNTISWFHYIISYDGTTAKLYRNGMLLASANMPTWNTTGTTLFLNKNSSSMGQPYKDGLRTVYDDLKIYDVALSEQQVKDMYLNEAPINTNDIIAHFPFENNLSNNGNTHSFQPEPSANAAVVNYQVGKYGNCIDFGSNSTAGIALVNTTLDNAIASNDNLTFSFWQYEYGVEVNDYATSLEAFGSLYSRDSERLGASSRLQNGVATGTSTGTFDYRDIGSNVYDGQNMWTHHTMVFKNTAGTRTLYYYINGVLRTTFNGVGLFPLYRYTNKIVLGGGTDASGNLQSVKFAKNLKIDEFYIINKAFTQEEVFALMNYIPASNVITCPTGNVTVTNQAEVDALASCTHITGNLTINPSNNSLDLSPLNGITTIDGNLIIRNVSNNQLNIFNNLTSVNNISISFNTFTELSGFNALTTINGNFQLYQDYSLTTITGFTNLATIPNGSLVIVDCTDLYIVNAFNNLNLVKGIWFQNTALMNVNFLSSLTQNTGGIQIVQNNYISNFNFPSACLHNFTTGNITISNNAALTSFGANGNFVIGNSGTPSAITVLNNSFLSNLGMTNSSSFSTVGNVQIQGNQNLANLNFLTNLTSANNITINTTGISNLSGLNNLSSCNDLTITNNASITSLSGINTNAFNVNGNLMISSNPNLTVIDGFNSININSFNALLIQTNSQLATCTADWVCDYLGTASPNATIAGNATGCESVAAVNTACAVLSSENFDLNSINLYPNPTNSMFTVEVPNDTVKTISVVDVMGKVVATSNVATVDVSNLASGIYIVKVETISGKTGTQKLIKN